MFHVGLAGTFIALLVSVAPACAEGLADYAAPKAETEFTWHDTCENNLKKNKRGGLQLRKVERTSTVVSSDDTFVNWTETYGSDPRKKKWDLQQFALCDDCGAWNVDAKDARRIFSLDAGKSIRLERRIGGIGSSLETITITGRTGTVGVTIEGEGKDVQVPVQLVVQHSDAMLGGLRRRTEMWFSTRFGWPLKIERWSNEGVACKLSEVVAIRPKPAPDRTQTAMYSAADRRPAVGAASPLRGAAAQPQKWFTPQLTSQPPR